MGNVRMGSGIRKKRIVVCYILIRASVASGSQAEGPGERCCLPYSGPAGFHMTSFSDLFKLGKEVLRTDTFVLHEAQTRGQQGASDRLSIHDITLSCQIAAHAWGHRELR